MTELFHINLAPNDARDVAEFIAKKADEAEKSGEGAEVYVRFVADPVKGRFSVNAAVITPQARLLIDKLEDL